MRARALGVASAFAREMARTAVARTERAAWLAVAHEIEHERSALMDEVREGCAQ